MGQVNHEQAVLRLPFQEDMPIKEASRMAVRSVIDAYGRGAWPDRIDQQAEPVVQTVNPWIHYLAAALREEVTVEASVLRRGRHLFPGCYHPWRCPATDQ